MTLIEFQKERAGSIDSYVQLRNFSLREASPEESCDQPKIAVKASQLLKYALQVTRGMVS